MGQWVWTVKPDAPKISTKLGKNWNESKPYFSERVGFSPGGIGPRSVRLFHGPAALASNHALDRLGVRGLLGRLAGEREHPMRTLELVGQRVGERVGLVERLSGFRGEGAEGRRMQIRAVVALREAVDEDLPVALQFGLEPIDLVRSLEGIALDAVGQLAEVVSEPTRCCAG